MVAKEAVQRPVKILLLKLGACAMGLLMKVINMEGFCGGVDLSISYSK